MPSEQKNVKKNIVEFLVAPDSAIDPFGIIEKALKPLEGKNFLRNYMRRKLEESPIVDAIAGMTAKSGLIAGAKVTDWRESAKELLDDVMLSIYKEYERTYGK